MEFAWVEMSVTIALLGKTFATNVTFERFFSSMYSNMFLAISFSGSYFRTIGTSPLIWTKSNRLILQQNERNYNLGGKSCLRTKSRKSKVNNLFTKRLLILIRMGVIFSNMWVTIAFLRKFLATNVTFKWFFSSMCSNMFLSHWRFQKSFRTIGTCGITF